MDNTDYRVPVHEAGHALVDVLFTGCSGRIVLDGQGNGACHGGYADADMGILTHKGEAYAVYRGCRAVAGELAERLMFGEADAGSVEDRATLGSCRDFLQENGMYLPRETFVSVASYLLATHRKGLLAMAKLAYDQWRGGIPGKALTDIAVARDPSLLPYLETPLLYSKGVATWRTHWQALCEASGVPRYARGLSDASW
jgi:hypothetical protein